MDRSQMFRSNQSQHVHRLLGVQNGGRGSGDLVVRDCLETVKLSDSMRAHQYEALHVTGYLCWGYRLFHHCALQLTHLLFNMWL